VTGQRRDRARQVTEVLARRYPEAAVTLTHRTPWELLTGAILASQCTDERVNRVTPQLFERFPDPETMAGADQEELESLIRSCGLFRAKAKALRGTARMVAEKHRGQVPSTREELMALPGVGRKIANLIVGDAFGGQAIVVDTHCARISRLLGFTDSDQPARIERDLAQVIPEEAWTLWGHLMVAHGRDLCRARCRLCFQCPVRLLCRYGKSAEIPAKGEGACV
jgi:endonuclease-3